MRARAASLGLLLALAAAPGAAAAQGWTVADRVGLGVDGAPVDLASALRGREATVRFVLSGSLTYLLDGSVIDALSSSVGGARDEAAGPFVRLPPGTRVVEAEPAAHRYVFEAPRAPSMPVAILVARLAARSLVTRSEASANLRGAITLEHLVPPPPPRPVAERAARRVEAAVGSVTPAAVAGGIGGAALLLALLVGGAWRRRDPLRVLARRAARAERSVAREAARLGPAFDPVAASAARLGEAVGQQLVHLRAIARAHARTSGFRSAGAGERRRELASRREGSRARAEELVGKLEEIAARLTAHAADRDRATGVERVLADLDLDVDAAIGAEVELGL